MGDPKRKGAEHKPGKPADDPNKKKKLDHDLDEALEDSFPASDPVSLTEPSSNRPAGDPKTRP